MEELIPIERIENKIYLIRGQKVMLDFDLSILYEIPTKALNQAVRRNIDRFPADFLFSLSRDEILRMSQFVTSSNMIKFHKNVNAFTENGVAMLSSVLKSKKAVAVNIQIMRIFTQLRQILSTHKELAQKFKELEARTDKNDEKILAIFEAIRQLMTPTDKPKRKIGFLADKQ